MIITGRRVELLGASALVRHRRVGLVLLPGVICAAIGFASLGSKSLWLDESVSATLVQLNWSDLGRVLLSRETNMALYHVSLKAWTEVFGSSEFAVRSFSVLCAAGAACTLSGLTARLFGPIAAMTSGLLYGVNPVVLVFAQTARGYALCMLLVIAAQLLIVDAVHRSSRSAWVAYALVTACAIYTNFLVVLLPIANLIALAGLPHAVVRRRDMVASIILLLVLVLPLGLRIQQANGDGVGWIARAGGGELVRRLNTMFPPPATLSLLAVAVLGTTVMVVRHCRQAATWSRKFSIVLIASWLVIPLSGILALSIAYRPLLVPRYLIYCLPALVILGAFALVRLRSTALTATALATAAAMSLTLDVAWLRASPKEDWRSAVAEVTARRAAADGILYYPAFSRLPFDYYRSRVLLPSEMDMVYPPGAHRVEDGLAALGPVPISRSTVAASAAHRYRLWLVVRREQTRPSTGEHGVRMGLVDAGLVSAYERCFTRVCISEYRRPVPNAASGRSSGVEPHVAERQS